MHLFTTPPYNALYCFVAQRVIFWGSKLWDTSIQNTYKCKIAMPAWKLWQSWSFCCGHDQMGGAVISQFSKLYYSHYKCWVARSFGKVVNIATWMFFYPWSHCYTLLKSQTNFSHEKLYINNSPVFAEYTPIYMFWIKPKVSGISHR